jgi:hypothetical protein
MKLEQLTEICKKLNEYKVKYVIVGGIAIILHGFERKTIDVDIIIDSSEENITKIISALKNEIPEIEELREEDAREYLTIKVVGKILGQNTEIDLIREMWGVNYIKARENQEVQQIHGVNIPIANIDTLIEMKKKSERSQDKEDLIFLVGKKKYLQQNK